MMRLARLVVAFCCAVAGAAGYAACPESGGIGGTGISTARGGIGGTGAPAVEIGIIGVINAFGSICVNGVEVEYDAATPVSANNAAVGASALALGQVVAVRATGNDLHARATRIDILDAVVGRVSAVDAASGAFRIGPQRVQLDPRTVIAGTTPQLQPGAVLRVSGLWRADGTLAATRVEPAPAREAPRLASPDWPRIGAQRLIVEGYVRSVEGSRINVGGLEFDRGAATADLRRDDLVRINARVEGERRVLERAAPVRPGAEARPDARGGRDAAPERGERSSGPDRGDRGSDAARPERGGADRPERLDRSGPDRPARPERTERPERSGPGRGG